jgi:hypothetical protein
MLDQRGRRKRRLFEQRPELVQRYMRISMLRRVRKLVFRMARFRARLRMLRTERGRLRALALAIESTARVARDARLRDRAALDSVANLSLFFLVAERDIQSVKIDALTHPDSWRRSLCARIILLTIHELDIDKAGGSRLKSAFEAASVPQDLRNDVFLALRRIRLAQQKAQKQFSALRHSTIAHRDGNAFAQYRSITTIDSLAIMQTVGDFYDGARDFISVMTRLIVYVGGSKGTVAEFLHRAKRLPGSSGAPL